mmetsp:Transcript_10633/g.23975  ORF Transcript_10633/g.23975 Transcript_10633/m.23975 type:complete len:119 (+) Transcript_10633:347-703(+)
MRHGTSAVGDSLFAQLSETCTLGTSTAVVVGASSLLHATVQGASTPWLALLSLILVHGKESRDTDLQRASVSTVLAHVSRALDGAGDDDESSSCASRQPSSAVLKSAFESARRNFFVK